ncbi:hypothetical protein VitviT2T_029477 [Vitis vinifera]|uniref:Uncharacterized protein n=1 Tax=Vitis vinifera TaxID=29760 RepID=A0ABY9E0C1_VITVI|nr:hypothetical protein VitviT2T_029477 [Vitis vinifera]
MQYIVAFLREKEELPESIARHGTRIVFFVHERPKAVWANAVIIVCFHFQAFLGVDQLVTNKGKKISYLEMNLLHQ